MQAAFWEVVLTIVILIAGIIIASTGFVVSGFSDENPFANLGVIVGLLLMALGGYMIYEQVTSETEESMKLLLMI